MIFPDVNVIAQSIGDDLARIGNMIDIEIMQLARCAADPVRDGRLACGRAAKAALAELPARIAARGPFTNYAAAEEAGRIETARVLSILDGTGMPTSGSA
jgi:hypothetical protein